MRRWFLWLLVVYVVLLGISHWVRRSHSEAPALRPDEREFLAQPLKRDQLLNQPPVRIVFRDTPGPTPEAPVVVLLHGSPGSHGDFYGVVPRLAERFRVIAPSLPGFGKSQRDVPDYSVRSHARYLEQLLDSLGVSRAHWVGFSMGGGVALQLYDFAPERVESLVLLSAIGVQEFELLGGYRLNHWIHGAQLGLLWTLHEAVPHMGRLDNFMLNVPYARNFYDTDQRPLREILQRFEPPMLILHGKKDFLVTPQTAEEHHRIVPHSELAMTEHGHFMLFRFPQQISQELMSFLEAAEAGEGRRREHAEQARIERAKLPFDPSSVPAVTGAGVLALVALLAIATLVSEDLTCIAAGLMVAQGRIGFGVAVVGCFLGIYIGDLLLYWAGRLMGRPALKRAPLRWFISEEQVEAASKWFAQKGPIVIGLSRFFPGARLPTYFAAGTLRTSFWVFAIYFFLAVAVWTPLLVALAMWTGEQAFGYVEWLERHSLAALVLLGLWILIVVKLLLPLFTYRGRRAWVARWRRWTQWEFWPLWLFYIPVVGWVLVQGLRHRNPLLFTAANPAMPASGFISESKADILNGLGLESPLVASTHFLDSRVDAAERVKQARQFMRQFELDFPVVLKPNAGQRGSGVAIVRDDEALERYLQQARFDALIQEHVPGAEFGVFYVRYPDRERGELFSITEKKSPALLGDGIQTIEHLILDDPRAVILAQHYLKYHRHQLQRVPAKGESLELAELGTHCRGALFLDGSRFATPELTQAIDEISRGYEGFFFGRYDVRTTDPQRFRCGAGFKIIELNGVTSEAAHIYDPDVSLTTAYRTLFRQWSAAFEIGRQNRARGARPAGLWHLFQLLREYRRTSRTHP